MNFFIQTLQSQLKTFTALTWIPVPAYAGMTCGFSGTPAPYLRHSCAGRSLAFASPMSRPASSCH